MTETQKQRLEESIDRGYNFQFGEYISQGFSLVQKNLGGFIGYTILYFVGMIGLSSIPIIGSLALALLSPALSVGFYIVAHKLNTGQHTEFGDFFGGFSQFAQLALVYIVMSLIMLVAAVPILIGTYSSGFMQWYIDLISNPITADMENIPGFPFWTLIFLLPIIYLSIAYKWAYKFVVFYKLEFWDALEYSRRLISKSWLIIFLFSIVIGILAGLGVILFLVGMLFTLPAMLCAEYAAFADVTGLNLEEAEDIDDISEHLVE